MEKIEKAMVTAKLITAKLMQEKIEMMISHVKIDLMNYLAANFDERTALYDKASELADKNDLRALYFIESVPIFLASVSEIEIGKNDSIVPVLTPVIRCDTCEHTCDPSYCAKCGKAKYCSKSCQKTAWKAHKKECCQ